MGARTLAYEVRPKQPWRFERVFLSVRKRVYTPRDQRIPSSFPISAGSLVASSNCAIHWGTIVYFLYNLDAYCHIPLPVAYPEVRPTAAVGLEGMNRELFVTGAALLR